MTIRDVELDCPETFSVCGGHVRLRVDNCSAAAVSVAEARFERSDGRSMTLAYPSRLLPPGGRFEDDVDFSLFGDHHPSRHTVVVQYLDGEGRARQTRPVAFAIRNPALARARRACDRCGGTWGGWGLLGIEGCKCRTQDHGRRCLESNDCQGHCMFSGFERYLDPNGAPMAQAIGQCSEWSRVFGCHAILLERRPPVPAAPGRLLRAPHVCID